MNALFVDYFDGITSRRRPAQLLIEAGCLHLRSAIGERHARLDEVDISEPMGDAPRTLRFGDGAFCEIAQLGDFDSMLAASGYRESTSVRLQSRWHWALGSLAAVAGCCLLAYFVVLPWAASLLAPRVPPEFSLYVSHLTLDSLDKEVLQVSKLPLTRQQTLQERMRQLAAANPDLPAYQLHFRASKLPPNAFALPSGDIVIYDGLADKLSDDEIVAVLSHELGHVHYYHGLRQMMQSAVVSTFAAVYFGDVSSWVALLATTALESRYSQAFELEADRYAGETLIRARRPPALLAHALQKLDRDDSGPSWFSSHPDSAKRIELMRAMH